MANAARKEAEEHKKGGKVGSHEHSSHHEHHDEHEGHVAHVHMHEKGGKVKKAAGGGVMPMKGPSPVARETDRGHKVKRVTKKHGGKVEGEAAHHHMGKKARGGRMTESSPFTEAGNMSTMPYMSEHKAAAPLEAKIHQKIRGEGGDKAGPYGKGSSSLKRAPGRV